MTKDLISVVVPVYNVEKYLDRCVESILNQTYFNLEIILVDDGSYDNSPKICDEYMKKDNRVQVIHKKNGGLSDARNVGIAHAKGKYITFIDSDDWVTEDCIEILYKIIKKSNSDISIGNLLATGDEPKLNKTNEKVTISDNYTMLINMMYQKMFDTSASGKLYDISLFKNIRFPKGKLYEDLATVYKAFLKSKRIAHVNKIVYFYYTREDSITNTKFNKRDMDLITTSEELLEKLVLIDEKNNLAGKLKKAAISRFLSSNFTILRKTKMTKDNSEFYKVCIKNIRRYKRFDIKSRLKNNVAVILFTINPIIVAKI